MPLPITDASFGDMESVKKVCIYIVTYSVFVSVIEIFKGTDRRRVVSIQTSSIRFEEGSCKLSSSFDGAWIIC